MTTAASLFAFFAASFAFLATIALRFFKLAGASGVLTFHPLTLPQR